MLFRLLLLLGIAAGLTLFALSNWTPVLALTFLGMQTPALPLAMWVLGAIAAGIVTSLLMNALFSFSNYLAVRQVRSQHRRGARRSGFQAGYTPASESEPTSSYSRSYTRSTASTAPAEDDSDWQDWDGYEEPSDRTQATPPAAQAPADDDWDVTPSDDWEDWESDRPRSAPAASDRSTYEAKQEPKTASRSGSVYSYGYREPGESGVGKREMVVDADYRVIVPPYQPPDSTPYSSPEPTYNPPDDAEPAENADDWFEDDFETDEERQRRAQQS